MNILVNILQYKSGIKYLNIRATFELISSIFPSDRITHLSFFPPVILTYLLFDGQDEECTSACLSLSGQTDESNCETSEQWRKHHDSMTAYEGCSAPIGFYISAAIKKTPKFSIFTPMFQFQCCRDVTGPSCSTVSLIAFLDDGKQEICFCIKVDLCITIFYLLFFCDRRGCRLGKPLQL